MPYKNQKDQNNEVIDSNLEIKGEEMESTSLEEIVVRNCFKNYQVDNKG